MGSPKLEYSYVKNKFNERGYELLSNSYKNNKSKLKYKCTKCGCIGYISYASIRRGRGCSICAIERRSSKRRKSFCEIVSGFEKEGYSLLTKIYVNCDKLLEYICPDGHTNKISWHNWNSGYRCPTCYFIKMTLNQMGELSHFWKGGISFEPYCEVWKDKEYKADIRKRDGYKCLNPYCSKKDGVLAIHHIDYNKKNCHPNNLITICRSCNSSANFDREWHKSWYQTIINRRKKI